MLIKINEPCSSCLSIIELWLAGIGEGCGAAGASPEEAVKMLKGLEQLGLFGLEKRKLQGDL